MAAGWEAPALNRASRAPLPWTEPDLFDYLREGHSVRHGSAGGPMAAVVQQLRQLPDSDVRAMAHYLASLGAGPGAPAQAPEPGSEAEPKAEPTPTPTPTPTLKPGGSAEVLYTAACGACHHDGDGPQLLGLNLALALNTNLHSERPDNVLRVVLDGVREPLSKRSGFMPGFRDHLDDAQIARLVAYLRERFAPERAAWSGLEESVARVRAARD